MGGKILCMCKIANFVMESKANENCSKTEQQKRARLDQRNAKDRARRSFESAEQRQSRLDKRNIDSMRRGHGTPKYHNAKFKVFPKASCVASLTLLC